MAHHSFFDQLVHDLIRSKQANYSEDCIPYYLDEQLLHIEDLPKLYNNNHERLKCTLVRHRHKLKEHDSQLNKKCVIYLHGLGSSRLQALNIAQFLPHNYCICMFDLSGGGKSQGDYVTYGIKEQEDITPIIDYLTKKKHIKEFVLWGRSMGAVATLLYALENYQDNSNQSNKGVMSMGQSLRNSMISSSSIGNLNISSPVKAIVLDSPFHNFRDIAKEIATKKLGIPNFILDIALNYVQEAFTRLLADTIGEKYNPFGINFSKEIRLTIPILFLHSEKDQIIPSHHCDQILRNITSKFQKIPINDCTHNQSRPEATINDIFRKLDKFDRQQCYQQKKLNESMSKDMTISYSCQRKRGIFVYTPSKEKDRKFTIDQERQSFSSLLRQGVDVEVLKTEDMPKSPRSKTSLIRKNPIDLKCSRRAKNPLERKQINTENMLASLNTIDLETHKLINQKLSQARDMDLGFSKVVRSKRLTLDKRREIRLTHQKYLE